MNYRIDQCYVSESVNDFDWYGRFNLKPYYDLSKPCIFIGMYRPEDIEAVKNHKSELIVKWTGYDSIMNDQYAPFKKKHIKNISVHPNVIKYLKSKRIKVERIPYYLLNENIFQNQTGNKIFAYCPSSAKEYHQAEIIKKIQKENEIIRGNGHIQQIKWHNGIKYRYYNKSYIGMVLNNYAGGVATILELASQGKYCITNAADFDNCLRWESINDIKNHINNPKYKEIDYKLIDKCKFNTFEPEWLYINI
jgi:hypothetical protein